MKRSRVAGCTGSAALMSQAASLDRPAELLFGNLARPQAVLKPKLGEEA
jgi:hypothetical protein